MNDGSLCDMERQLARLIGQRPCHAMFARWALNRMRSQLLRCGGDGAADSQMNISGNSDVATTPPPAPSAQRVLAAVWYVTNWTGALDHVAAANLLPHASSTPPHADFPGALLSHFWTVAVEASLPGSWLFPLSTSMSFARLRHEEQDRWLRLQATLAPSLIGVVGIDSAGAAVSLPGDDTDANSGGWLAAIVDLLHSDRRRFKSRMLSLADVLTDLVNRSNNDDATTAVQLKNRPRWFFLPKVFFLCRELDRSRLGRNGGLGGADDREERVIERRQLFRRKLIEMMLPTATREGHPCQDDRAPPSSATTTMTRKRDCPNVNSDVGSTMTLPPSHTLAVATASHPSTWTLYMWALRADAQRRCRLASTRLTLVYGRSARDCRHEFITSRLSYRWLQLSAIVGHLVSTPGGAALRDWFTKVTPEGSNDAGAVVKALESDSVVVALLRALLPPPPATAADALFSHLSTTTCAETSLRRGLLRPVVLLVALSEQQRDDAAVVDSALRLAVTAVHAAADGILLSGNDLKAATAAEMAQADVLRDAFLPSQANGFTPWIAERLESRSASALTRSISQIEAVVSSIWEVSIEASNSLTVNGGDNNNAQRKPLSEATMLTLVRNFFGCFEHDDGTVSTMAMRLFLEYLCELFYDFTYVHSGKSMERVTLDDVEALRAVLLSTHECAEAEMKWRDTAAATYPFATSFADRVVNHDARKPPDDNDDVGRDPGGRRVPVSLVAYCARVARQRYYLIEMDDAARSSPAYNQDPSSTMASSPPTLADFDVIVASPNRAHRKSADDPHPQTFGRRGAAAGQHRAGGPSATSPPFDTSLGGTLLAMLRMLMDIRPAAAAGHSVHTSKQRRDQRSRLTTAACIFTHAFSGGGEAQRRGANHHRRSGRGGNGGDQDGDKIAASNCCSETAAHEARSDAEAAVVEAPGIALPLGALRRAIVAVLQLDQALLAAATAPLDDDGNDDDGNAESPHNNVEAAAVSTRQRRRMARAIFAASLEEARRVALRNVRECVMGHSQLARNGRLKVHSKCSKIGSGSQQQLEPSTVCLTTFADCSVPKSAVAGGGSGRSLTELVVDEFHRLGQPLVALTGRFDGRSVVATAAVASHLEHDAISRLDVDGLFQVAHRLLLTPKTNLNSPFLGRRTVGIGSQRPRFQIDRSSSTLTDEELLEEEYLDDDFGVIDEATLGHQTALSSEADVVDVSAHDPRSGGTLSNAEVVVAARYELEKLIVDAVIALFSHACDSHGPEILLWLGAVDPLWWTHGDLRDELVVGMCRAARPPFSVDFDRALVAFRSVWDDHVTGTAFSADWRLWFINRSDRVGSSS